MYKNLCGYLCIVMKSIHVVLHCTDLFRGGGKTSNLILKPQSSITSSAGIVIKKYRFVKFSSLK